jgi:hypothetical protein
MLIKNPQIPDTENKLGIHHPRWQLEYGNRKPNFRDSKTSLSKVGAKPG